MSSKSDISRLIVGEPIRVICKLRVQTSYNREDVKLNNNRRIQLIDQQNRLLNEYEANDVYAPSYSTSQIFELGLRPFVYAFMQGFNATFLANGTTGAGKSFFLEGDRKEPGLILLTGGLVFSLLEKKKLDQEGSGRVRNYDYSLRIKYCEIIHEEVTDLLAFSYKNDILKVVYNEWEGPTVANSTWISVTNINEFNDFFLRGQSSRNKNVDEFGRLSSKATGYFVIELTQISEPDDSEKIVTISRLTFFDLPGVELLDENQDAVESREGPTANKSLFAYNNLVNHLVTTPEDPVLYDTSSLTTLLRDAIGGNSYTVSIHCLQYGDTHGSDVNLKLMTKIKQIRTFPITNEGRAIGMMRLLRREANKAFDNLQALIGDKVDGMSLKYMDLEKKLLEENLQKVNDANDKQALTLKLKELQNRYNELVKDKADLQAEMIASEEEKLQISKSLVELQIENTKLMEIIQNEKFDANNKIVDQEGEILQLNVREEQALQAVQELQDKLVAALEDKKELEIEFVAVKKNFLNAREELELEKEKNENLRIELINTVNENKALQGELNAAYKNSTNATEDGVKITVRYDSLQTKYNDQQEAMIMQKAEIERLKLEMTKYELKDQQYRLEVESKKQQLERGFLENARDGDTRMKSLNEQNADNLRRAKQDKLAFGSERQDLMVKTKQLNRKAGQLETDLEELRRLIAELRSENTSLKVQMDEKESIYRQKLMQYTIEERGSKDRKLLGYEAKTDLVRSYKEKEVELMEKLDKERQSHRNSKTELLATKRYSRQLKYLAEDWAPVGQPLPDLLTAAPPTRLDDVKTMGGAGGAHADRGQEEENERLRKRIARQEEEIGRLTDHLNSQGGTGNVINTSRMAKIPVNPNTYASPEGLRKEKAELRMENERLMRMMKDSGQYDIYVLRQENERLMKTDRLLTQVQIKEFESNYGNASPISGDVRALSQKIAYYEKSNRDLQREVSELLSRSTLAEEQLKSLQEHLARVSSEYQKKIQELKRQLS